MLVIRTGVDDPEKYLQAGMTVDAMSHDASAIWARWQFGVRPDAGSWLSERESSLSNEPVSVVIVANGFEAMMLRIMLRRMTAPAFGMPVDSIVASLPGLSPEALQEIATALVRAAVSK